jgi:Dynamin family
MAAGLLPPTRGITQDTCMERGEKLVFEMPPLGQDIGRVRNRLLSDLEAVAQLSGGTLAKRAGAIRARVKNNAVRIGVIGQIKAGKSSTINALTRRPGLLPSDVNPWTTVVTQLHFGHPSGKTAGAIFRFFNEAEWSRLANRGGRLGELTEGLLEESKRDKLAEQVIEMRARAESRLGSKFNSLIGKAHRFDQVTPDLLQNYVAAGDEPNEIVTDNMAGRFADLTHSAEIFFPQEPFGFPLTLIDTPGVNDPLLIREEITQQSIETADHFIVVLSAHQTLSKSDVRLIRLLKALNRDRFVIFVNRLDEIRFPADEFDRVREKVIENVKRELGGKEVSVVIGSAAWANFGLTGDEDVLDRSALAAFVEARGLAEPAKALDPHGIIKDPARSQAYLASGLQELVSVVSDMVSHGPAAEALDEATSELLGVAQQALERSQIRLALFEEGNSGFRPIASAEQVREHIAIIDERVRIGLAALSEGAEAILSRAAEESNDIIDQFVSDQVFVLKEQLASARRGQVVSCNVDPLRRELESLFTEAFERLGEKMVRDAQKIEKVIVDKLPELIRERIKSVRIATRVLSSAKPQIDCLYRTVTAELAATWLTSIFGASPQRITAAMNAVRVQFHEMCNDLLGAGVTAVGDAMNRVMEEFRTDAASQLNELAGLTESGDFYSPKAAEKRMELQEQARGDLLTAEYLVETLKSHQIVAHNDTEQA